MDEPIPTMTGPPKAAHKTDDIRRSIGKLTEGRAARWIVTSAIIAVAVALIILSFSPGESTGTVCRQIVTWATALFTVEISFRMIGQRVDFLGKPGNVADLIIIGMALVTPLDAVLMLRLFPVLSDGAPGFRTSKALSASMMLAWSIACIAALARDVVLIQGGACIGWQDCIKQAVHTVVL